MAFLNWKDPRVSPLYCPAVLTFFVRQGQKGVSRGGAAQGGAGRGRELPLPSPTWAAFPRASIPETLNYWHIVFTKIMEMFPLDDLLLTTMTASQ